MMQKINKIDLDLNKWDALVERNAPDAFFSYSWYLNAVAENWCVFVDASFTKGIAFTTKKNVVFTSIFTANFSRYAQFIGAFSEQDFTFVYSELSKYSNINISFNAPFLDLHFGQKVYQKAFLKQLQPTTSSQAVRANKKALAMNYVIKDDWNETLFYQLLDSELGDRDEQYLLQNIAPLKQLVTEVLAQNKLLIVGVYLQQQFLGACLCIKSQEALLYLKGICSSEAKQNGAMHFMFHHIQEYCRQNSLVLDFGGSNISGIRQFFMCYGGEDVTYYTFQKSKLVVRILKKIKEWIKKK
jgi:hypothetical protein